MSDIPFPTGLSRYLATELDLCSITSSFELVEENVHLQLQGARTTGTQYAMHGEGLYFFLMSLDGMKFKIYLGRTNALSRRMREYSNPFQPHSPNDFKLQAFQCYLSEFFPQARLDLFFQRLPSPLLPAAEDAAIKQYLPLLNERSQPTHEARKALQDAFSQYVRSTFEQRLA
ncbi:hypothetical protein [Pseudomonas putida]|uniref:hypothetical protein n=1 Tax=Pseudomonas putida TaxID=303 RepID=UPI0021F8A4B2|nr:hypothetical protein [Pseudomonas putida]